jgi:anti-sigma factor RsiW
LSTGETEARAADAEDTTGAEAAQATTDLSITVLNKVTGKPWSAQRLSSGLQEAQLH